MMALPLPSGPLTAAELQAFILEVQEGFARLQPCSHFGAYLAGYEAGLAKWQASLKKDKEAL